MKNNTSLLERIAILEAKVNKLTSPPVLLKKKSNKVEEQKAKLNHLIEKSKRVQAIIKEKIEKKEPIRDLELLTVWASDTESLILTPLESTQTLGFTTQDGTTSTAGQVIPLQTLNFLFNELTTAVNNANTIINGLGSMAYQDSDNVDITGGTIGDPDQDNQVDLNLVASFAPLATCLVGLEGSTINIVASYNIASITNTATGQYQVTFTNEMPDTNYNILCQVAHDASPYAAWVGPYNTTKSTTGFRLDVYQLVAPASPTDTDVTLTATNAATGVYFMVQRLVPITTI